MEFLNDLESTLTEKPGGGGEGPLRSINGRGEVGLLSISLFEFRFSLPHFHFSIFLPRACSFHRLIERQLLFVGERASCAFL